MAYIGRFAPSPTGPLHLGSLVCAMASFLDAKAHQGQWLLRIEDIDESRVVHGADLLIMQQLKSLGMYWDHEVVWQTSRKSIYQHYFETYRAQMYGCVCTRKQLHRFPKNQWGEFPYPGTCRFRDHPLSLKNHCRLAWPKEIGCIVYQDRLYGEQTQSIDRDVGDIVVRRSDGYFSYQWVVVIDDALQNVTDIVRGADLLSSTPRQIALQKVLGFSTPRYLHIPLVLDERGLKLSKQNHAPALNLSRGVQLLKEAFLLLGLSLEGDVQTIEQFWQQAILMWSRVIEEESIEKTFGLRSEVRM